MVMRPGAMAPVVVKVKSDASTPVTDLLKKAANIEKGSATPNKAKVGTISRAKLREIAEMKMKDLNAIDIEGAERTVEGAARSMGITIS